MRHSPLHIHIVSHMEEVSTWLYCAGVHIVSHMEEVPHC